MKPNLRLRITLFLTMVLVGSLYGILYHYLVMPAFGSDLIHCVLEGTIFGLINYFLSIRIFTRLGELKKDNKTLRENMNVDKLTALLNRRAFDNDALEMANKSNYALIFIDIDDFRRFNNEFGHKTGDLVLQKVSRTIKDSIRRGDRAYRYGGEEIVVLLKDCDKNNASDLAEKIRMNISKIDNSGFFPVTVSLGVASCPEDGTTFAQIVTASDRALLMAKESGKNRICV